MAIHILETLGDLLSASSGALVGAIVTALFHRGRNKTLTAQVMAGQTELEKQQMENQKLLAIIKEKESIILQMQMNMLSAEKPKTKKIPSRRK